VIDARIRQPGSVRKCAGCVTTEPAAGRFCAMEQQHWLTPWCLVARYGAEDGQKPAQPRAGDAWIALFFFDAIFSHFLNCPDSQSVGAWFASRQAHPQNQCLGQNFAGYVFPWHAPGALATCAVVDLEVCHGQRPRLSSVLTFLNGHNRYGRRTLQTGRSTAMARRSVWTKVAWRRPRATQVALDAGPRRSLRLTRAMARSLTVC